MKGHLNEWRMNGEVKPGELVGGNCRQAPGFPEQHWSPLGRKRQEEATKQAQEMMSLPDGQLSLAYGYQKL